MDLDMADSSEADESFDDASDDIADEVDTSDLDDVPEPEDDTYDVDDASFDDGGEDLSEDVGEADDFDDVDADLDDAGSDIDTDFVSDEGFDDAGSDAEEDFGIDEDFDDASSEFDSETDDTMPGEAELDEMLDGMSIDELRELRAEALEWKAQQESAGFGADEGFDDGLPEFDGEIDDTEPEESALDKMLEDIDDEEPEGTELEEIDEEEPGESELGETDDTGAEGSGSESGLDQPSGAEFTPEQDQDVTPQQDQDVKPQQDQDVKPQQETAEQRRARIEAMVDAYIEHLADTSENDDDDPNQYVKVKKR